MPDVSNSEIRLAMSTATQASNPSTNWASLAISIARVKEVMYEDMKCTLVVLTGERDVFEYTGVDITLAGGGKRTFFGVMPERGDLCYVGWAARESAGTASTKAPIILGWVPAAPWMGHEWIPYQAMEPGEGMDTVRDRSVASGTMERTRFKMRHVAPGNVVMSSGQGSDIVLDDGVLLTNRRANEIRLRDEDQAMIVRSLQQFQAFAGVRTYGGMVQREARLLPSSMWSDGVFWDRSRQTGPGQVPLSQADLTLDAPFPDGFLTPGIIFTRNPGEPESEFESARGASLAHTLDPFDFLRWGAFITNDGFRADSALPGGVPNTVYGGKALYRVGLSARGEVDNAVSSALQGQESLPPAALTEWRLEMTHTADGTLPVTEQTDGLDAEKLPSRDPSDGDALSGGHQTFIEHVLGSVVGNDPFSLLGRPLYGLPLKPVVFTDAGEVNPAMISAVGSGLQDHAATLFRITPPVPGPTFNGASFTSWTKDGRFKAFVAGGPVSGEVAFAGDFSLSVGGSLNLHLAGGIHFNGAPGPGNVGVSLGSPTGAVVISGGGALDSGSAARDAAPGSMSGNDTPSLLLQGSQNVTMRSDGSIVMGAPTVNIADAGAININAQNLLTLRSGARVSITAASLDQVISGRENTNYGGPHEGNPANGATRQVIFSATPATGHVGGVVDRYKLVFGDREEEFLLGNHTTKVMVGDLTYKTLQGKWKAQAGTNSIEVDSTSGISQTVPVGSHSTTVSTGSLSQTAQTDVSIRALTGSATLAGSTGVTLKAPGAVSGDIMCGADRDPLTGIPYSQLGMLPRLQKIST